MDGKPIKMVLQWLLARDDLTDGEIAAGIGVPASTFSRRKDEDDYPSFEEIEKLGAYFQVSARVLHIAFGYLGLDTLALLDDDEMRQYLALGGGNHAYYPLEVVHHHPLPLTTREKVTKSRKLTPREDAPPM